MPINIANGSDLNQPKFPLTIIAGENAIINAENIPAVFPAMFLTNKNIIIFIDAKLNAIACLLCLYQ